MAELASDFTRIKPAFKKMLPNVRVDFQQANSADQMMNTFKIRQSANEMPDAFYLKPAYILELAGSKGYCWGNTPIVPKYLKNRVYSR